MPTLEFFIHFEGIDLIIDSSVVVALLIILKISSVFATAESNIGLATETESTGSCLIDPSESTTWSITEMHIMATFIKIMQDQFFP